MKLLFFHDCSRIFDFYARARARAPHCFRYCEIKVRKVHEGRERETEKTCVETRTICKKNIIIFDA